MHEGKPEPEVVCFGEVLLRLSPPGRRTLSQANSLDLHFGGAEANVAVGLASLGHRASLISVLPSGALGDAALTFLRGSGVEVGRVSQKPGRLGLYFLTPGASLRASEILYDRNASAFATTAPDEYDWPSLLEGADWLHLSGITPALGPASARAALNAANAARQVGVKISFDGNYRAKLWERWESRPRDILLELIDQADLFFGNHWDVSLLLDRPFSSEGPERRREAAEAAFGAFPRLWHIASTARHVEHVDRHRIAARIDTRQCAHQTEEIRVAGIVDRIGAGDAFAAGILHGLIATGDEKRAVETGLALTCLKHSLPGDAALFSQRDIAAFESGFLDVRR